jgi:hypothetical protein
MKRRPRRVWGDRVLLGRRGAHYLAVEWSFDMIPLPRVSVIRTGDVLEVWASFGCSGVDPLVGVGGQLRRHPAPPIDP